MARRISNIKPEKVEDYIIKHGYSNRMLSDAAYAMYHLKQISPPDHIQDDYNQVIESMDNLLNKLREYDHEQYQAIVDNLTLAEPTDEN